MGNELCVASGGTPNLLDMVVTNNTEIPLQLDTTEDCRRDCKCKGYQVAAGKIVEGRKPPDTVRQKCTQSATLFTSDRPVLLWQVLCQWAGGDACGAQR